MGWPPIRHNVTHHRLNSHPLLSFKVILRVAARNEEKPLANVSEVRSALT